VLCADDLLSTRDMTDLPVYGACICLLSAYSLSTFAFVASGPRRDPGYLLDIFSRIHSGLLLALAVLLDRLLSALRDRRAALARLISRLCQRSSPACLLQLHHRLQQYVVDLEQHFHPLLLSLGLCLGQRRADYWPLRRCALWLLLLRLAGQAHALLLRRRRRRHGCARRRQARVRALGGRMGWLLEVEGLARGRSRRGGRVEGELRGRFGHGVEVDLLA
jgi:hypothetical protein